MTKTEFQAIWERNQLVLYLCKLYPCWLEPNGESPLDYVDGKPRQYYKCFIVMPTGIMSWEIIQEHLRYFSDVESKPIKTALRQTASEQYHLLREMPQQWEAEATEVEVDDRQMELIA